MPLDAGTLFPPLALHHVDGQPASPVNVPTTLWCVYKTECPTCVLTMPFWQQMAALYRHPAFRIVAVAQNTGAEVKAFFPRDPSNLDLRLDPEPYGASRVLGIEYTPTAFLVQDGRIETVVEAWQAEAYAGMADTIGVRLGLAERPSISGFPRFRYG